MKVNYDDLEPGLYIQRGDAIKAVGNAASLLGLLGGTAQPDVEAVANQVAIVFTALAYRGDRIASLDYMWMRDEDEIESPFPRPFDVAREMQRIDKALQLRGEAYLLKQKNGRGRVVGLRWLDPETIKPDDTRIDPLEGYRFFWRTNPVTHLRQAIAADDIIRIMTPSQRELDPDTSVGQVTSLASQVLYGLARTQDSVYDNNGLPVMLVMVPPSTSQADKNTLETFFRRIFNWRGSNKTVRTVAVREGVSVERLSTDPDNLAMTEVSEQNRRDILAAHRVPWSIVYDDAANYATAQNSAREFTTTMGQRAQMICDAISYDPDMEAAGVKLTVAPERHHTMQRDEADVSTSWLRYVQGGMSPWAASWLMGLDFEGIPSEIEAMGIWATTSTPALPAMGIEEEEETAPDMAEEIEEQTEIEAKAAVWRDEAAKFKRWYEKRNEPDIADFTSDVLDEDDKARLAGIDPPQKTKAMLADDEIKARYFKVLDRVEWALQQQHQSPPNITVNVPERGVNVEPARTEFEDGE